ncbi:hypothetical protein M8J75_011751 [Diaphorina citri]|nr:hypothetical protein M8J75_011751 [Diaphorina citri]
MKSKNNVKKEGGVEEKEDDKGGVEEKEEEDEGGVEEKEEDEGGVEEKEDDEVSVGRLRRKKHIRMLESDSNNPLSDLSQKYLDIPVRDILTSGPIVPCRDETKGKTC